MNELRFTDSVQCGFDALDQHGRVKRSAVARFVMDGYGRAPGWGARGEHIATTGLSPITTYLEVTREPHQLHVDQRLEIQFANEYGFVPGRDDASPRYGGRDRIEITDEHGTIVARWRQHWLWHRVETGELVHTPAPGVPVGQEQLLDGPPPRPGLDQPVDRRPFRWTTRETDVNQHINVLGYLERAENALADADGLDPDRATDVRLWFRRPAFLADAMVADTGRHQDVLLVELRRTDPEELCAVLAFA